MPLPLRMSIPRLQRGEILEDLEAVLLAFLGVELRREQVVAPDHGREGIAVVTDAASDLRIARTKLPEDTFRFHEDAGALRYVDQGDRNGLNPISIRFNAVASALSELGLVAAPFGVVSHGPTTLGEELLDG